MVNKKTTYLDSFEIAKKKSVFVFTPIEYLTKRKGDRSYFNETEILCYNSILSLKKRTVLKINAF